MKSALYVLLWSVGWLFLMVYPIMWLALNLDDCAAGGRTVVEAQAMLSECTGRQNLIWAGFFVIAGGIWLLVTFRILRRGSD